MSWRVGIQIMLTVLASALIVLGLLWWLPLAHTSGTTHVRGTYALFYFAALILVFVAATFAPSSRGRRSRSEQLMERARQLRDPHPHRKGVVVATVVVASSVVIAVVTTAVLIYAH